MRVRSDSAKTCSARRNAFTLYEVLLAMSVMVVLATALVAAIDFYRHVTSTGFAEIEQAQLARAILRGIERDIKACVYRDAEEENPTVESSQDEQDDPTDEFAVMSDEVAAALIVTGKGMIGDENTLIIHAARPPRQVDFFRSSTTAYSVNHELSESRSVAYFLAISGAEGLRGIAGDQFVQQNAEFTTGLARLDGDRFSIAFSDNNRDTISLLANTRLLAEEVQFLQFRYYDGVAWQTTWNSDVVQRLPHAVEISIGFRDRSISPDRTATAAEIPASQRYRYVVAVPRGTPAITN